MVEIDSDGSMILESPDSMEKKKKIERAKELEDKITHMRHRKVVEDAIKHRRDTALRQKKAA
jgi:CMP-N-acetylneuraminic acid synthetase